MLIRKNIYLSPLGEEGGVPQEPTGGEGASSAPAFDASQYVSKADFDSLASRNQEWEGKFNGLQDRLSSVFGGSREQEPAKAPSREDFIRRYGNNPEAVEKWIDARSQWIADSRYQELTKNQQKVQSEQQQKAARQTNLSAHVKRIGEASSTYKDWDNVVSQADLNLPDGTNNTPDVFNAVIESEHSAGLTYLLAKNPGEKFKLLNAFYQGERQGNRYLGMLEARIESEASARKAAAKKGRFQPTATNDVDANGNPNEADEFDTIARNALGIKPKS